MSALFNHAIRWEFTDRNPITGPVRGSGVRQSAKRGKVPEIPMFDEVALLFGAMGFRERVMVFSDITLGLRRSELTGLQWGDFDFEKLLLNVQRAVVDQHSGQCKTVASEAPLPLDPFLAELLKDWRALSLYRGPEDWVFASETKQGRQPLWLSTIMRYHIQPLAKQVGVNKWISWQTFRRACTTYLHANGENVKTIQELARDASSRVSMDVYCQAITETKRDAHSRVVAKLRPALEREKDAS